MHLGRCAQCHRWAGRVWSHCLTTATHLADYVTALLSAAVAGVLSDLARAVVTFGATQLG